MNKEMDVPRSSIIITSIDDSIIHITIDINYINYINQKNTIKNIKYYPSEYKCILNVGKIPKEFDREETDNFFAESDKINPLKVYIEY